MMLLNLDEAVTDQVHAQTPYSGKRRRNTALALAARRLKQTEL